MHFSIWRVYLWTVASFIAISVAKSPRNGKDQVIRGGSSYNTTLSIIEIRGDSSGDDPDPNFYCLPHCSANVATNPLSKRSSVSYETFTLERRGLTDIFGYDQTRLGQFVAERTLTKGVKQIFGKKTPTEKIGNIDYYYPTSLFSKWGSKAFSWATTGLAGCTALIMVNPAADGGVYIAHYWEVPGFMADINSETESIDTPKMFDSFVTGFITDGYPADSPNSENFQKSVKQNIAALKRAQAWIMTPKKSTSSNDEWASEDSPEYPNEVREMKYTLQRIDPDVQIQHEYIYDPERFEERSKNDPSCRFLFEYDPVARLARLILEDGGYGASGSVAGPGGPFVWTIPNA